jgi:hypothetical protein
VDLKKSTTAPDPKKDAVAPATAAGPAARVPVFFDARPWAAVLLDGRKLCTTPCYYDLVPGSYTFTFRHDPAKLEKKATYKVRPAADNRLVVDLK